MDLELAEKMVNEMIDQYCPHVIFEWSRSKTSFGSYGLHVNQQHDTFYFRITLSKPLTYACDQDEVEQTIIHEIAHAIVGTAHGHGEVWKAKVRELGGIDNESGHMPVSAIPNVWKGICTSGHEIYRINKPRDAKLNNTRCGICYHNDQKYVEFVWEKHNVVKL